MLLPLFLIPGAVLVSASNLTLSLLARGPTFSCSVLPIEPTTINGLTPCGTGSITAGCDCCDGGLIGCLSPIESCASGSGGESVCVCNQGYDCSSCDYQGLTDCGSGCLPGGYTCCPDQTYGCPASQECCTLNGADACCDPGSDASSTTAAAAAAPSSTDTSLPTDATSTPAAVSTGGGSAPSSAPTAPSTTASSAAGSQRADGIAAILFAGLFPALCHVLSYKSHEADVGLWLNSARN